MAITKELFEIRLKEAALLLGQRVDKETARLIYERIRNDYKDVDVTIAIDICIEREDRLNYPAIKRALEKVALAREEAEWKAQKKQEEYDSARFWRAQQGDPIARDHIQRITAVLNGEMPVEPTHRELAALYPGIGHERYLPDMEPF